MAEKANGDFVRDLIVGRSVCVCHDVSDGGLAVALAEMALAGNIGATIGVPCDVAAHATLFGEDQARYLVVVPDVEARAVLAQAEARGVPCARIGTTGGNALQLGEVAVTLDALRQAHEGWLPTYMS